MQPPADPHLDDPFARFAAWYDDAERAGIAEPGAMVVATATADGVPSARVVLLRGFDRRGFVFYTNHESRKGRELGANPRAALCIHWAPLERQVRIEGRVEVVSDEEADRYWAGRPRESQIGAWASRQSEALADRAALEAAFAEVERRWEGRDVPRPPHWSGYRVVPARMEFWQSGLARLHERDEYRLAAAAGTWTRRKLYP